MRITILFTFLTVWSCVKSQILQIERISYEKSEGLWQIEKSPSSYNTYTPFHNFWNPNTLGVGIGLNPTIYNFENNKLISRISPAKNRYDIYCSYNSEGLLTKGELPNRKSGLDFQYYFDSDTPYYEIEEYINRLNSKDQWQERREKIVTTVLNMEKDFSKPIIIDTYGKAGKWSYQYLGDSVIIESHTSGRSNINYGTNTFWENNKGDIVKVIRVENSNKDGKNISTTKTYTCKHLYDGYGNWTEKIVTEVGKGEIIKVVRKITYDKNAGSVSAPKTTIDPIQTKIPQKTATTNKQQIENSNYLLNTTISNAPVLGELNVQFELLENKSGATTNKELLLLEQRLKSNVPINERLTIYNTDMNIDENSIKIQVKPLFLTYPFNENSGYSAEWDFEVKTTITNKGRSLTKVQTISSSSRISLAKRTKEDALTSLILNLNKKIDNLIVQMIPVTYTVDFIEEKNGTLVLRTEDQNFNPNLNYVIVLKADLTLFNYKSGFKNVPVLAKGIDVGASIVVEKNKYLNALSAYKNRKDELLIMSY